MSKGIFYYYRDSEKVPRVCVCLLKDKGGNVGKGISICSLKERPILTDGKNRARGRAKKALVRQSTNLPVNRVEAQEVMVHSGCFFPYKSIYNPELNELESKLTEKVW